MYPYRNITIPLAVICNTFEAYIEFLQCADSQYRDRLFQAIQTASERVLLWLGDPKLAFTSSVVPHVEYLKQHVGYRQTNYACPTHPTSCLSLDILNEPSLLHQLVSYAGAERTLQLVPYATTPQFLHLVNVLRTDYHLNVITPESPNQESRWIRDYIETKMGFRTLAYQWLDNADMLLPRGFVCQTLNQAAMAANWFLAQRQSCIIKANNGLLGIGQTTLHPSDYFDSDEILAQLQQNLFLHQDLLIVEEYIQTKTLISPSVELFVPPMGDGQPRITQVCQQYFSSPRIYAGELISRELEDAEWYELLTTSGLKIAARLQAMGYVGHFDLDSIVADGGCLFLLEVNARRTGGTHVDELARFLIGDDYLDAVVLLSRTSEESGTINQVDHLMDAIHDLLYPMQQRNSGIVITHSSALANNRQFGYVIIAESTEDALALQQRLVDRIHKTQLLVAS
jgi:hypothetical protein